MEKHIEICLNKWARTIEPNDTLAYAYLQKSRHDLVVLRSISEEDTEWKSTVAYYARYHILTALLLKIGMECKNHNCSLKLAEYLFQDMITINQFKEIKEAKKQRINLQYYTDRTVEKEEFEHNMKSVDDFVDKIQQIIESITREDIEKIRKKIE